MNANQYRWFEFTFIFIILPLIGFNIRQYLSNWLIPALIILMSVCCMLLLNDSHFKRFRLTSLGQFSAVKRRMFSFFFIGALFSGVFYNLLYQGHWFTLPRENLTDWLMLLMLYPLLSVIPQELIFSSVFIVGESGTGKEVCAEAVHRQSDRKDKPFIAINCGAIPRDLMESEIFGHVKGAFTGATTDRKGAATLAHGGTLFLDELCEMELEMQKKLLRFLQTGTYTPLGGTREMKVDVRIICATNRDPLTEVEEGRFREDLYYRVHVIPIDMPPLRERGSDIVTLAKHFLTTYAKQDKKKFSTIDSEVQHIIKHYEWPGNVRQLQNIIRNIVVLNNDEKVTVNHLPAQLTRKSKTVRTSTPAHVTQEPATPPTITSQPVYIEEQSAPAREPSIPTPEPNIQSSAAASPYFNSDGTIRPMWQVEREAIQNAIAYCDGNVLNAAVMLELSPSTVYRKKQAWEADEINLEQS